MRKSLRTIIVFLYLQCSTDSCVITRPQNPDLRRVPLGAKLSNSGLRSDAPWHDKDVWGFPKCSKSITVALREDIHCQTYLGEVLYFQIVAEQTCREEQDKQYLSSLQQQRLLYTPTYNYTTNALYAGTDSVMLREKCQDYLPLIMIWQPRELWFESDLYLSSLTPRGTEHTQEAAECLCGSVLTIYCTNVAICSDQKNAVWMRLLFPVSELIWLFPQITHWPLLAVQNNFLGWLYAIYCQSKLQVCAEMVRKQPKKRRGEHMCTMQSVVTEGIKASKTRSCAASSRNPSTRAISSKTSLSHHQCLKDQAEHQKTSVTWFCLAKMLGLWLKISHILSHETYVRRIWFTFFLISCMYWDAGMTAIMGQTASAQSVIMIQTIESVLSLMSCHDAIMWYATV